MLNTTDVSFAKSGSWISHEATLLIHYHLNKCVWECLAFNYTYYVFLYNLGIYNILSFELLFY